MMLDAAALPALACAAVACGGLAQAGTGAASIRGFTRAMRVKPADAVLPAISVLKPLYGAPPGLAAALESFFRLDYPRLQLVFCVAQADDPSIAVVEALRARYPAVDAVLVRQAAVHGANRKIANLMNGYPHASHDVLLISDADMTVAPDYLRRVAAALARPGVGLVTTIYTGLPVRPGRVGELGAAYITQIFASGALMARSLGRRDCMGATMCLTRETLARIGGLPALLPYVADDGVLGKKVLALGLDIALAETVPATSVTEARLGELFSHELRWARTIRAMAPNGFILSALQYPVAWALAAWVCAGFAAWGLALLAAACATRALAGRLIERALGVRPTAMWLAPLRDLLSMAVFAAAFFGEKVAWNGLVLSTAPDRHLTERALGGAGLAETQDYAATAPSPVLLPSEG